MSPNLGHRSIMPSTFGFLCSLSSSSEQRDGNEASSYLPIVMGEVILIVPRVLYSNRRLWVQLEVLAVYSLCYGSLEPRFHSLVAFVDGRIL